MRRSALLTDAYSRARVVAEEGIVRVAKVVLPSWVMNLVRDAEGGISFGLVDACVYFSRFTGKLSSRLGTAHLKDLQQALDAASGAGAELSYFADASELTSYDLLARSAFVRLLLSYRKRFSEIVILNWAGGSSATGKALAESIGEPVEMLTDRHEFEHRVATVAPRALPLVRGPGVASAPAMPAAPELPASSLRVTRG